MDAIRVRRVAMRCRISSSNEAERARAQRVFRDDVALALEDAVALAGVAADEQICIRKLQMSARLWIGLTDAALRRAWAEALASDIRRAIATGGNASVVRYESSVASVLDALRCLARGDMARQWAWQQLALATAIPAGGGRADAICDLLLCRPDTIVAALRALTDEPSFWRLIAALDDARLGDIADAALAASGIPLTMTALAETAAPDVTAIAPRARLVARRARIARHSAGRPSARRSMAIAALATLEVEPALLRGDSSAMTVAISSVAAIVHVAGDRRLPDAAADTTDSTLPQAHDPRAPMANRLRSDRAAAKHRPRAAEADEQQRDVRDEAGAALPSRRGEPIDSTSITPDRVMHNDSAGASAAHQISPAGHHATRPDAPHHGTEETAPHDCRIRARSEWAGLLFLINVLRDGELIGPLLDDSALAHRPSPWVLHRLALVLVPSEPTDPAALAFAGLPPGQLPEDFAGEIPNTDEQSALLSHARACVAAVCARLGAETGHELLYSICARTGEIVADPGWIEVRFPLDTIAVDVRRAGFDLDPGYIPWLGIVMKFAYV